MTFNSFILTKKVNEDMMLQQNTHEKIIVYQNFC